VGYVTEDLMRHFFEQTVEDVSAYLAGSPLRVLNPDVRAMTGEVRT
jgi:hypothetical protein